MGSVSSGLSLFVSGEEKKLVPFVKREGATCCRVGGTCGSDGERRVGKDSERGTGNAKSEGGEKRRRKKSMASKRNKQQS